MTLTAKFLLLCGLVACSNDDDEDDNPDDDVPPPPPPEGCIDQSHTQVSTQTTTEVVVDGCGSVSLGAFQVLGEGTFTVDLFSNGEQVIPHVVAETDGAVFRGLVMSGSFELAGAEPLRLWPQADGDGARGIEDLPAVLAAEPGTALEGTAPWAGLVGRADGAITLIGTHSALGTTFHVEAAADGGLRAVWGGAGEALPLNAGGELFLDPLFVWVGPDPTTAWTVWASSVAATLSLTTLEPEPLPPGLVVRPTEGAGDAQVADAIAQAVAWRSVGGVVSPDVILVDAGWEHAVGTWEPGPAFPSGLAAAAQAIRDAEINPALWLAPFAVDPAAAVAIDHPDWWVTDPGGVPIVTDGFLALDVTNPAAAAWLQQVVAARVEERWTVFVLDHLSVGAIEGVRAAPTTGTAAYRSGLALIRAAAGPRWLVAVDAPMLPTAGLVDGFRGTAGSALGRSFLDGLWWWNDAGDLTGDPLTGPLAAAFVAGGSWSLPAPLPLPPDDLVSDVFDACLVNDPTSLLWTPVDPLAATGMPPTWTSSPWTALLNLTDGTVTVPGPGGTELLSDSSAEPGDRVLAPEAGEIWAVGTASTPTSECGGEDDALP